MRALPSMLILAFLSGAMPAIAQVDEDIITTYVGDWLVLPVDGRPGCGIALSAEESIGGRAATPADDCAQHVPEIADASAWYPTDGIAFFDPIRQPVLAFTEDETALLSSPDVADPVFYLVPALPGLTHVPKAADMPGTWMLAGKDGKSFCSLTLSVPSDSAAKLGVPSECGSALPKDLKQWRLEALNLFLEGDDDAMVILYPTADDRFASDDDTIKLQRAAGK